MQTSKILKPYHLYIDGEWVPSAADDTYSVIYPATTDVIAQVAKGGIDDASRAVDAARDAFESGIWSRMASADREKIMLKLADLIEQEADNLATLETLSTGKTIKISRDADLPFAIDIVRWAAGAARCLEGTTANEFNAIATSFIRREPIGVVVEITPWNYPFLLAMAKVAPALAVGNAVVIKPPSIAPLTTLEFARLAEKAGVPKGVVNVVTGPGETVGEALVTDPDTDVIGFTGDTVTGRRIMELASRGIKRVQLELGGKAPFIVLDDCDLEAAAEGAVVAAFNNVGQDCTAAARFYVQKGIYSKFIQMVLERTKKFRIGDPQSRETDQGPLVSASHRAKVESLVSKGIEEGAKLLTGGKRPSLDRPLDKGFYYEPTIFSDVTQDMQLVKNEIFGPVMPVIPFNVVDEAVQKANDSIYGLSSSIWTKDIHKAMKVTTQLKAGAVWVNDHLPCVSEMPHGGYKQSGFGKDLSMFAFDDYTVAKHVYIDLTGVARKPWHYIVYGAQ